MVLFSFSGFDIPNEDKTDGREKWPNLWLALLLKEKRSKWPNLGGRFN